MQDIPECSFDKLIHLFSFLHPLDPIRLGEGCGDDEQDL